jgi:hypothetical protein
MLKKRMNEALEPDVFDDEAWKEMHGPHNMPNYVHPLGLGDNDNMDQVRANEIDAEADGIRIN